MLWEAKPFWKGGRVVECTGLENQQGRKFLVGSNPTPSARKKAPQNGAFLFGAYLFESEQRLRGGHRGWHIGQLANLRHDLHVAHDPVLVGDDYGARQQM